jgi:hypothetical protein
MNERELNDEKTLLNDLEKRSIKAFMRLYKNYNEDLLIYAYSHLHDSKLAIKTVEEFFEDLWAGAKFTAIDPPIYRYLARQMRTLCERNLLFVK